MWDPRGADERLLRRMAAELAHRGPDEEGFFCEGPVGLGSKRLAIIDLETGTQPVASEDGRVVVVQNGEIYNYRELREQLERAGHRFRTRSDTEVLVHLYEEAGTDFLRELRGMFALALWDGRRRRLVLARDRLGIKPLLYGWVGGRLLFASELRALLRALPRAEPDTEALGRFLALMYAAGERCAVRGVRRLPPAHYAVLEGGAGPEGLSVGRYWEEPAPSTRAVSLSEAATMVREALLESVRLRLRADVPVGLFLSGGVDSSCVAAAVAALGADAAAFTADFNDPRYSERRFAAAVVARLGLRHEVLPVERAQLRLLPRVVSSFGEPFADSSALPTWLVAQAARRHVKVVLAGDGGDELFAGYDWTRWAARVAGLPRVVRSLARLGAALGTGEGPSLRARAGRALSDLAGGWRSAYLRRVTLFDAALARQVFVPALADAVREGLGLVQGLLVGDGTPLDLLTRCDRCLYLPGDDLAKVDAMTMAHGLEARVPLLDHLLVELAVSLPPEAKLRGATSKLALKKAFERELPGEVLRQRKQGFSVPIHAWFAGAPGEALARLVRDGPSSRWLLPGGVEKLLEAHRSGRRRLGHQLYALACFELWLRFLEEGAPGPEEMEERYGDLFGR